MSYIESAEDFTDTHTHTHTLELIKEFSKIERYKIQHKKSVECLFTYNEQSKTNQETVPFTITSTRMKCLGMNLIKVEEEVYTEN